MKIFELRRIKIKSDEDETRFFLFSNFTLWRSQDEEGGGGGGNDGPGTHSGIAIPGKRRGRRDFSLNSAGVFPLSDPCARPKSVRTISETF